MTGRLPFPARTSTLAIVVAAVVFAVVAGPLAWGLEPFGLDATRYDLPILHALQRVLVDDRSPWVFRELGNHHALAAEAGATLFSPMRWMSVLAGLLGGIGFGRTVALAVHLALAAAGTTVLARSFRVGPREAVGGGLLLVVTGPVVDLLVHSDFYAAGLAWFPWLWACARGAARPGTAGRRWTTALSVVVALAGLCGDAQALLLGAVVVAGETLARRAQGGPRMDPVVARVVGAGVVGGLVGLPQTALLLGEMPMSRRASGFTVDEVLSGALDPTLLPGLVFPGLTEAVVDGVAWTARWHTPTRWVAFVYVSGGLLALFIVGTLHRRLRSGSVVALLLGLLSLGAATPLGRLAALLPVLSHLRYPAKLLPFALVAVLVVAMGGLTALRRARSRRAQDLGLVLVVAIVVVAASFIAWDTTQWPRALLVRGVALTAVVAAVARRRRPGAALALLLLDVGAEAARVVPLGPPVAEAPSLVAGLARDPRVVLCTPPSLAQARLPTGIDGFDGVAAWRAWGLHALHTLDGVRNGLPYQVLQSSLSTELEMGLDTDAPAVPVALGCTHVVTRRPVAGLSPAGDPDVDAVTRAARGRPGLFVVHDPLPEAFVVSAPLFCPDEQCVLEAVFATNDTARIRRVVDDPLPRDTLGPLPDGAGVVGVDIVAADDEGVTLRAHGSGGAVLAVKRALLVGHRATQAGAPLRLVRANGNHLAVVVEDVTRGDVVVSYEPPLLVPGLVAAAAGLVLGGLLVLRGRR